MQPYSVRLGPRGSAGSEGFPSTFRDRALPPTMAPKTPKKGASPKAKTKASAMRKDITNDISKAFDELVEPTCEQCDQQAGEDDKD